MLLFRREGREPSCCWHREGRRRGVAAVRERRPRGGTVGGTGGGEGCSRWQHAAVLDRREAAARKLLRKKNTDAPYLSKSLGQIQRS